MKLYIYRLEGCKTCEKRRNQHNELAAHMQRAGIEVIGVKFGMVDGERVTPLEDHDSLCRKDDDQMKYQAPVYILDSEKITVKLPDMGGYTSIDYAREILNMIQGEE